MFFFCVCRSRVVAVVASSDLKAWRCLTDGGHDWRWSGSFGRRCSRASACKDSTDSLKSMLTSFFQRTHPEWSMDDVKAHVAALDMEPVSQKYVDRVVCW